MAFWIYEPYRWRTCGAEVSGRRAHTEVGVGIRVEAFGENRFRAAVCGVNTEIRGRNGERGRTGILSLLIG